MKKTLLPIQEIPKKEFKNIKTFLPGEEPELKGNCTIPVASPNLSKKARKYLMKAFDSTWISSKGKFIEKFEYEFAKKVSKTKYAFGVNSGTSALHLALASLGITRGDEVILPTFTMIATANAISYCGATPIFVDSQKDTWNIDVSKIEEKITKKTKAILIVHLYGLSADMDPILKLAKKYKLWVIEDNAEAIGGEYKNKRLGSIGDVSAFSLYANKTITTGEGGVVATDNPEIAERIELLKHHAFSKGKHFWHTMIGYSYAMTNLQAAIGVEQLEKFETFVKKKCWIGEKYSQLLKNISGIILPSTPDYAKHVYWMYGILVNEKKLGLSRDQVRKKLANHGIETRSFFVPLHFQPIYFEEEGLQRYPVANRLCKNGLYLPSSTELSTKQIQYITSIIQDFKK